jgi:diguanylate cyclase (GGDEF)-like protein/PAS domain S-box-containing protein
VHDDVTASWQREPAEAHLRAVLGVLEEGIVSFDATARVVAANASAHRILGLDRADLDEPSWWERLRPRDADGTPVSPPLPRDGDQLVRITRPGDGRTRVLLVRQRPLEDGGAVISLRDQTDERRTREQLAALTVRDTLTGLPNRAAALAAIEDPPYPDFALLLVDVDAFRAVNMGLGQHGGDAVLREAAARLRGALPRSAGVARFGGDEFLVLAKAADPAAARAVAERVRDGFDAPFESADGARLTASIGVAMSGCAADGAGLIAAAEAALAQARAHGRGLVEVFDDELRRRTDDRRALTVDLRSAIEQEQIEVVYQPIVDLLDARTRTIGVEALARWTHPDRGPIPPSVFVALAEEAGMVQVLGRRVLVRACREIALLDGELRLSVNVSGRQVAAGAIDHDVRAALTASGLDPAMLALELTESALMADAGPTIDAIAALRLLGVRLLIDDFGTGYSSLARLRRLPVDGLKIDRSFVAGLGTVTVDTAIVEAVLTMAHALRLPVVAEGVETDEQSARLRALGCPRAQGYLFGRPMSLAALRERLDRERRDVARSAG